MSARFFFASPYLPISLQRLLLIAPLAAVLLFAGCTSTRQAPIEDRRPQTNDRVTISPGSGTRSTTLAGKTHTVRQGDTLFSIAQSNQLDYRDLAAWNNLDDPSKLSAGQVLRLSPPEGAAPEPTVTTAPLQTVPPVTGSGSVASSSAASSATYKTEPKAVKEPYSEQALLAMSKSPQTPDASSSPASAPPTAPATPSGAATTNAGALTWSWPTQGKVISTYSEKANLKGIDIVGSDGQPVKASAAGRVVYTGSGLRGYGKMIVIKHNDTFLSVYAHNSELLAQQGQEVTRGQKIAEMGNTDADQVKLHFEIRKDGKPVDPMQYLPPR